MTESRDHSGGRSFMTAHAPVESRGVLRWHVGMLAGVGLSIGLLLLIQGQVAGAVTPALACIAVAALIGMAREGLRGAGSTGANWMLVLWALAAAIGGAATGGLGVPFAALILLPLAAAAVLELPAPAGLGAAAAAAALAFLIARKGVEPTVFAERGTLGFIALVWTGAALAAGWWLARPRVEGLVAGPAANDLTRRLTAAETARAAAESARLRAETESAARARFLANMSHELRTPLNAIMGFSDMMRARMFGEMQPKYAEYAGLIHESGAHLLDLINDVLDLSKIEAERYVLSREAFDVREALNGALRLMRQQAEDVGVTLRAVLPPEPVMVDADKRAIKQVTLNLLSNAVKFTPQGGVATLSAAGEAEVLEITVSDTGVGIAPEDVARLGRPFEQAGGADDRAQGTGLGLSLVAALAKLHGGEMRIESRLGEGTAVSVRLPVVINAPGSVAEPDPATLTS